MAEPKRMLSLIVANLLILGSRGMLGSEITTQFSKTSHKVIEANTTGLALIPSNFCLKFDINSQSPGDIIGSIDDRIDFIINCTGVIKHKIDEMNLKSVSNATKINSEFPQALSDYCKYSDTKIIQIATDCVFTGNSGNYFEDSAHDAADVYGATKSKGEVIAKNMMILRCSVIGRELSSHIEFMDWILEQPIDSALQGFTNHHWNGLTTYQFAKIVLGIIDSNSFRPGIHHVLPSDSCSKFELMQLICDIFGRSDIKIEAVESESNVDRRLSTRFPSINDGFWRNAGYDKPLSIQEMIDEYSQRIRAK